MKPPARNKMEERKANTEDRLIGSVFLHLDDFGMNLTSDCLGWANHLALRNNFNYQAAVYCFIKPNYTY